jgi:hypothetical protein
MSDNILSGKSELMPMIRRYFREYLVDLPFGVKLAEVGGGRGDALLCVPLGGLRRREEQIVKYLQDINNNDRITMDYANWLDGYGTEGLKVDQILSEKIFSPYISKGSLRVQYWDSGFIKKVKILNAEELEKSIDEDALVIDKLNQQMVINGKKTTSKDLPTTKTTIELLDKLLSTNDKSIDNCEMPASSYATSRNDLQGKIVTPLNKLIKKSTGKDFRLVVRGNTNTYRLTLEASEVPICLIDKVF